MRRLFQFMIFFGIWMSLSLTLHYYIFSHLAFMLRFDQDIWFWVAILVSSVSFFGAMALEASFANGTTRAFYISTALWLGFIFILLFTLIGYDVLRFIVAVNGREVGPYIIVFVVAIVAIGAVNAQIVRIRKVKVPAKKLDKELKVVHLTDIHIGSVHCTDYLERIVRMTNDLEPDLVMITGDLADGPHRYSEESFKPLDDLKAPVFFTTGNHEFYAGLDEILQLLEGTKVQVLRNAMAEVGGVQVVGVDNHRDREIIRKVLEALEPDPDKYTILMYHRPTGYWDAKRAGVDLMLSGHTHGGQFFPFTMIVKAIWRRTKGLYNLGGTHLYASPGTGTWGPPLRIGTSNVIALLRLMPTKSATATS
jgi:predicted MPP superfamily phosphohydrolase